MLGGGAERGVDSGRDREVSFCSTLAPAALAGNGSAAADREAASTTTVNQTYTNGRRQTASMEYSLTTDS
jgi:hypothetical protein